MRQESSRHSVRTAPAIVNQWDHHLVKRFFELLVIAKSRAERMLKLEQDIVSKLGKYISAFKNDRVISEKLKWHPTETIHEARVQLSVMYREEFLELENELGRLIDEIKDQELLEEAVLEDEYEKFWVWSARFDEIEYDFSFGGGSPARRSPDLEINDRTKEYEKLKNIAKREPWEPVRVMMRDLIPPGAPRPVCKRNEHKFLELPVDGNKWCSRCWHEERNGKQCNVCGFSVCRACLDAGL